MANIKDPAFWHRFSVAVHLDEESTGTPMAGGSSGSSTKDAASVKASSSITPSTRPALKPAYVPLVHHSVPD